jgi:hypothetical protein
MFSTYRYRTKCAVESDKDEVSLLFDPTASTDRKVLITLSSTIACGLNPDGEETTTTSVSAVLTDKAALHIATTILDALVHGTVPLEGTESDSEFYI